MIVEFDKYEVGNIVRSCKTFFLENESEDNSKIPFSFFVNLYFLDLIGCSTEKSIVFVSIIPLNFCVKFNFPGRLSNLSSKYTQRNCASVFPTVKGFFNLYFKVNVLFSSFDE